MSADDEAPDRDALTWVGLVAVGVAAAVMSFTALADLARMVGVTAVYPAGGLGELRVSWLFPITVDVLAVTATRVWLRGRAPADAVAFARLGAWAAIVTTTVGNGLHGALVAEPGGPPWAVGAGVSALVGVALGYLVHLAHLVGRPVGDMGEHRPAADPWLSLLDDVLAEPWHRAVVDWVPGDRAAALLAQGATRRQLARELRITEHKARELIAAHGRNGSAG